jgi:hypothetical protein
LQRGAGFVFCSVRKCGLSFVSIEGVADLIVYASI